MNEALTKAIISMRNSDLRKRQSLLEDGRLYDGYDEDMEALHVRNAEALMNIVDEHGWPGKSMVGEEGAKAAFLVAQHAISTPEIQQRFLAELRKAVAEGEAAPVQAACLEDRILFNQGKPCRYGMLFDWDGEGNLVARVDDETLVDRRRARLGLSTLAEALEQHREAIAKEGGGPPSDIAEHKRMEQEWAERVGWR